MSPSVSNSIIRVSFKSLWGVLANFKRPVDPDALPLQLRDQRLPVVKKGQ
jgi:hypothetical protein